MLKNIILVKLKEVNQKEDKLYENLTMIKKMSLNFCFQILNHNYFCE